MGCGASTAAQIAPYNNNDIITNHTNDKQLVNCNRNANIYPPKAGFKFAFFANKINALSNKASVITLSIGIQTETDINGIKTQYTQTDIILLPEDELELMMNESESDEDSNVCNKSLANDSDCEHMEVDKSVLLQTEETHRKRNSKKLLTQVTIDVGIQVKKTNTTSATQTRFGSVNTKFVPNVLKRRLISHKLSANLRKAVSVDIDNYHLWTSPSKAQEINKLDEESLRLLKSNFQDFESQTDPLLSTVLAANSAGNDLSVLQSYDISSPFAHIEKELLQSSKNCFKDKVPDSRFQDCLNRLLDDMDDTFNVHKVTKCDASIQTDNDILTDEAPEYAARPPPCHKREMIPSVNMFRDIDKRVLEAPKFETLQELVNYICKYAKNDLFKVRGVFRWITNNIKFDWNYMGVNMTSNEILKAGEGVCKDYCQLFADMCRLAGIRVKKIEGFAKGQDYRPGHQFKPGEDITHTWNSVFLMSTWRLIDTTWGTGYTDPKGQFQRKLNEHFFLTDPEILIWTHFPYNEMENSYCRWQLLDKPLTLDEFNSLPKVGPYFFDFNLRIRTKPQNPVIFRISTEIKIGAHEAMRYKYKLYPADEVENSSLNHYVFCQLKEDRLVGSFAVTPPIEGRFFLKIFAKPEREMQEGQDSTSLQNVCTFLLECSRARKYIEPLPINELPWGPTQTFYDFKLRLHNQTGPVIVTWGGKRRLLMEANETMLITYSIFDAEGMEMDTRSIISREDNGNKITFTVNPPRVGTFKFMIFGMPKPKQKGKWRLPLLATFMVDCKLIKPPQYDEDPPPVSIVVPVEEPPKVIERRKLKPIVMR